jgi:pyruvate formate lyase activating enzyme
MKKAALLYETLDGGKVRCNLCSHRCEIAGSLFGICGVRRNTGGRLETLVYGEAAAAHVDPIEKKPFYHFLPGSRAYSISTIGCNFRCVFCQNWQISQTSKRDGDEFGGRELMPERVVLEALANECLSISYTYTEPTIFFEYARDTALLAKKEGLANNFVTNGYMTRETLDMTRPWLDAANVDLKGFTEDFYRKKCGASLAPVLDSIARMRDLGIWVEVTTLLIPGENDSPEELGGIARFIAKTDKDMPWHISRFHPDYKLTDRGPTPVETLRTAKGIGVGEGVRYVYLGNVSEGGDTNCHECGKLLIKRGYFAPEEIHLADGRCPSCKTAIPGIWSL